MSGRTVVVGAGPAGLAAAWELTRHGIAPLVLDRNTQVGGLARTIRRDGYGFDLGPHRFFTKNAEVLEMWRHFLGDDLLEVPRLTRIYYRGRFFNYPLKPLDALTKLGPITTARAIASYGAQRLRRAGDEPENFEDWIVAGFGRRLYEIFFKTYTEKVWGIPCDQIGKEWAGQRIKGLDLAEAIRSAFRRGSSDKVKSLIERFYYPRRGAGELYERMTDETTRAGGEVRLGSEVVSFRTSGDRIESLVLADGSSIEVDHAFVSAPITAVAEALDPSPSQEVLDAARTLYYRSHITVNLVLDAPPPFPDNWIYIHAPELRMARVANYASFSTDMIGAPSTSALSVEYFCFTGDDLWNMTDEQLVELATDEMQRAGLLARGTVRDGFVVREADSYPTYYLGHREHFDTLFGDLSRLENLSLIGRAGMYRYNNQDHASLTGLYAVRNHLGTANVDLFSINPEDVYIEEVRELEGDHA
jgi:protoporphyrinogen oxidase